MEKILVVDDSFGWRNFHKKKLNEISSDFEITLCDWARDAYDIIYQNLKNPYDLIITDLQMESDFFPLLAGEWLIERIQEISSYRNKPILIISATYNIEKIANDYNVDFFPKSTAVNNEIDYKYKILEILKKEF